LSRAMIDQVIFALSSHLNPYRPAA